MSIIGEYRVYIIKESKVIKRSLLVKHKNIRFILKTLPQKQDDFVT